MPTIERYPSDDMKKWLNEEDLQKKRPKMEKRKQQDERKEAERRQKGEYKRNANERAIGNIQTQKQVYEGLPRPSGTGTGKTEREKQNGKKNYSKEEENQPR
jgi:hypothetical protein